MLDEFAKGHAVVPELAHQLGHLVQEAAGGPAVGELAHQHLPGVGVADAAAVGQFLFLRRAQPQFRVHADGQDKGQGHARRVAAAHLQLVDGLEHLLGPPGQEMTVPRPCVLGQVPGHQLEGPVHVDQNLAFDLPQIIVQRLAQGLQFVRARALLQFHRRCVAQAAQDVADVGESLQGLGIVHQPHVQAEGHEIVEMVGQFTQRRGGLKKVRCVAHCGEGVFEVLDPAGVRCFQPFFIA